MYLKAPDAAPVHHASCNTRHAANNGFRQEATVTVPGCIAGLAERWLGGPIRIGALQTPFFWWPALHAITQGAKRVDTVSPAPS